MTYSPQRMLDERAVWRRETGLAPISLGIQHYLNANGKYTGGGGYHAGNDLLRMIGRLDTDYSKRQSARDRPGTDGASAIDIGYFDVNVQRVDGSWRRVTLRDYNVWMVNQLNAGAPDVAIVRELIYSLDGRTVKRWDREGQSTTGDLSHTTHTHRSDYRDEENANKAAHVERFWREMKGQTMAGENFFADPNAETMGYRVEGIVNLRDRSVLPRGSQANEALPFVTKIKDMDRKLDLLLAEAAADRTRDEAHAAALKALAELLSTGGGDVDVAAVVNAVNAAASDVKSAVLDQLEEARERAEQAARASAEAYDDEEKA